MLIHYMQNRGWPYIYHFLIYTVAGFRHLRQDSSSDNKMIVYIPYMKEKIDDIDMSAIQHIMGKQDGMYPELYSNPNTRHTADVNYEILDYIRDEFKFIYTLKDIPNVQECQFTNNHGEPLVHYCYVRAECYPYLRNLFLKYTPRFDIHPGKRIYITRKNSENLGINAGIKRRQVLNEDDVILALRPFGFQFIHLEDYSFAKKIELFQTSEMILSPNSGALVFSVFANEKTTIVELIPRFNPGEYNQSIPQDQYQHICHALEIPYIRFQEMKAIEGELNMIVDIPKLLERLNLKN